VLSSAPGKQGYTDAAGANSQLTEYNASPTAVLLDPTGKVGHLYAAKTTPHLFIIGPNGVIVYQGAIDSQLPSSVADVAASDPWFKNALDATLAGQPVAKGTTKTVRLLDQVRGLSGPRLLQFSILAHVC